MALAERHRALESLDGNRAAWGVKSTPPDRKHYPHTFLWDGAFVAIVRAHYGDAPQAAIEITEILSGQKENGMVPNMKFGPGRKWDPERRTFMDPEISSDYSQPPLLAHATWDTSQKLGNIEGKKFTQEVYPRLTAYYVYLDHTRTDPGSSLIAVIHPHETGRDSGPEFDFSKHLRLPQTKRGALLSRGAIDKANTAFDYIEALGKNMKHRIRNWDVAKAREVFWFKDVMFNSIYAQNLDYMGKLAQFMGDNKQAENYTQKAGQVEGDILSQMWSKSTNMFHGLNETGRKYKEITVSNLFPITLPHVERSQAEYILGELEDRNRFNTDYPIPTVPVDSKKYDPSFSEARLWRGPVWMNMNWYIANGLLLQRDRFNYEDPAFADRLNAKALQIALASKSLVERAGYREFYNPDEGYGMRVDNFAWSTLAHLLIDKIPEMVEFRNKMSALD